MEPEIDALSLALDRLTLTIDGSDRIKRRFDQVDEAFAAFGERMDRHFAEATAARKADRELLRTILYEARIRALEGGSRPAP